MPTPLLCRTCGAPLPVAGEERRVRCAYCGATHDLPGDAPPPEPPRPAPRPEPPRPEPPRPAPEPAPRVFLPDPLPAPRPGPRDGGRIGLFIAAVSFGLPALVLVAVGVGLMTARGPGQAMFEHMQWDGTEAPLLVDVDGDGTSEIVGLVRFLEGEDPVGAVAAFDVTDGDRRWVTRLPGGEAHELLLAATPGRLWLADGQGRLRALDPATGAVRGEASLGEKPERFCGDGAGGLRLRLRGNRAVSVDLGTGAVGASVEVRHDDPCLPGPWTSSPAGSPSTTFEEHLSHAETPQGDGSAYLEARLRDHVGRVDYYTGRRARGTGVPMVQAYDGNGVLRWSVDLPSVDPLQAEEGEPESLGLAAGRLFVPWALRTGETPGRLTCLDAATGRRLWEAVLPDSDTGDVEAIVGDGARVFVSTWTWLHVLDANTGAVQYTIGVW